MLTLDTQQVIALQGGDGQAFTRFVDAVLRAELAAASITQGHIETNQRNQKDGGVDTAIDLQVPNDLSGYLGAPTCWQYKAQAQRRVTPAVVAAEVKKPQAAALIRQGYAWRLAVADEISNGPRQVLKTAADAAIKEINPAAPEAMILTASDLACWASRYLAVVLLVSPPPSSTFLDHRAYAAIVQHGATPIYVDVPSWTAIKTALRSHADFSQVPPSPVLTVQGEAGVGKTRLVFEVLAELDNVHNVTVYTENAECAESIAYHLARAEDARCILVVDECSPELRALIERTMQGTRSRCRVIALDNSGIVASRAAVEAVLPKMSVAELETVLATNFSLLPKDRRRAYADAAEGFVKLAADLCAFDPLATSSSLVVPGGIEQYVKRRTSGCGEALEAVSLVWRCGFRDQLSTEFRELCAWLRIDEVVTRAHLRQMKDRPGFVRDLGRYAYVTPDLVAQLAFRWAWQRWAEHDVGTFLKTLPGSLLDAFIKRVQHSGSEVVRRMVGEYFREWLASLTAKEVQDVTVMKRATLMVEADVVMNLPVLERLICSMSMEDLREVKGQAFGGWGPRRHLVWLLEQLARLPECFRSSASMLRRLAIAESEPGIGNNATAVYRQLFRIYGSGTATPYSERVDLLKDVLTSASGQERVLAVSALEASLDVIGGFRLIGPPLVSGRLPPREWNPSTSDEHVNASRAGVSLLVAATQIPLDEVRQAAVEALVTHTRRLLAVGFLGELRSSLRDRAALQHHGSNLLREIDAFLRWDLKDQNEAYVDDVRSWSREVAPDDLSGRLVRHVGRMPAVLENDPAFAEWEAQIRDIARSLFADKAAFATHLLWLSSDKARAAGALGGQLGELDQQGELLDCIVGEAESTSETALARGYCAAYSRHSVGAAARVAAMLDRIEESVPATTYELSLEVEPLAACVSRIRRLVACGKLPAAALGAHRIKYGSERLGEEDAAAVLGDLVDSARRGDSRAVREAVEIAAVWVGSHGRPDLARSAGVRASMWQVAEVAVSQEGAESYHWSEVVQSFAVDDPRRVIKLCISVLLSASLVLDEVSEVQLSRLATTHGSEVVAELGRAMLDEGRGWALKVGTLRSLVAELPLEEVKAWVVASGVNGARALARHLQPPHVASGAAVLHPLTEYVLSSFEDDEETFSAFCSGTHSMQVYQGDIAALHQAEADSARPLLSHPLRRVRQWAEWEVRRGENDAATWRRYVQERETDF